MEKKIAFFFFPFVTVREMGDALELVVDVQLGCHQQETKRVHGADGRVQDKRVPAEKK